MKNIRMTIWVMIVLCFGLQEAHGTLRLSDGQIHNIDYVAHEGIIIQDNFFSGKSTTVNLLSGSYVGCIPGLRVRAIITDDRSILNIFSGSTVDGCLDAFGNSQTTISGGKIRLGVFSQENALVTITGGEITQLHLYEYGRAIMSGGSMKPGCHLYVEDDSSLLISGGLISKDIFVGDYDNWDGREFNATLTFLGTDFAIKFCSACDSIPIDYGEFDKVFFTTHPTFPHPYWAQLYKVTLTGTLASGDPLNSNLCIHRGSKFVLIPPPYCTEYPSEDLNLDCKIDFRDFAMIVNFNDFAMLAASWLECNLVPESACW